MINDVLLVLLGAIISTIFTRSFAIFRTKYQLELNPKFYNAKVIKYTLRIANKIEPYLLKACGVFSFAVGTIIFVFGFLLDKLFFACMLLPFFIIAGCMFYSKTFPFKVVLKRKNN
jgi:hypothetical protein